MEKIGIYIYNGASTDFLGVDKKISGQISVFSKYYHMERVVIEKEKTNLIKSLSWRLPGGSWGADYESALRRIDEISQLGNIHFFYIRQKLADKRYVSFLFSLKQKYPNALLLFEIPAWPYDKEVLKDKTMWPWYFKDLFYSKQLNKCVNRIVTFADEDYIWNIQTIKAMNGMDVSAFSLSEPVNDDRIKLIGVAMMQPYHGFERIIKGLARYYENGGDRDIQIDFIGYGTELENYLELTQRLNLSDRIHFKGKMGGEELDKAYNGCDLAIGSLGGYKIGIYLFSSIKLGEYLAKGLPIVTGGRTLVFEKYGGRYNLDFPNDDSDIDMNRVVEFYDGLYSGRDKAEVRKEIHDFAQKSIDINIAMRDVISYLRNGERG